MGCHNLILMHSLKERLSGPVLTYCLKSNIKQMLLKRLFCLTQRTMVTATAPVKNKMKAWKSEEFAGIEGTQLADMKIPLILKPSEVLVKVSAASVNPLDIMALDGYGRTAFESLKKADQLSQGSCETQSRFPLIVGRDFAGKVVRVGHSVSNVEVNDEVWGVVLPQRHGSHAEYVVTESFNVSRKPESLTDIEAASIPYIGLTGWSTVAVTAGLKPYDCYDKSIIILGASGGVGTFLSQLLTAWGAQVVGVCNENAFELLHSLGVSELYDYRDPQTFNTLTANPGFDFVIDAGGENNQLWSGALKHWNNAACIYLKAPLVKETDKHGLFKGLWMALVRLTHSNTLNLSSGKSVRWAFFMPNQTALQEIGKLVDRREIRPVIDKVFKMEDARLAYQHVRDGPNRGKTVIDMTS